MAKKIVRKVKLHIPAGSANPAPPVGPALGQHGVNIMEFCKQFNAKTAANKGILTPVEITIFSDKSFTFITKTPPASVLLKKALGVDKGSSSALKTKVGKLKKEQIVEIAKTKLGDLNTNDLAAATKIIAGTARSIGIEIV